MFWNFIVYVLHFGEFDKFDNFHWSSFCQHLSNFERNNIHLDLNLWTYVSRVITICIKSIKGIFESQVWKAKNMPSISPIYDHKTSISNKNCNHKTSTERALCLLLVIVKMLYWLSITFMINVTLNYRRKSTSSPC